MADLKISALTAYTAPIIGDVLPIVDTTNATTKKIDAGYMLNSSLSRQAIINGNFDVWQRGTTSTNPANSTFPIADRWALSSSADGGSFPTNIVHSRQALTSGDIYGSYYHYRIAPDGAGSSLGNNSYYLLRQNIEHGTRLLCGDGKKVTLSFLARSSLTDKRIGIAALQTYGTGGTPTSSEVITGTDITLTSSWTKYTHTFTTNTLSGKTFGTANDDYLRIFFMIAWGSTQGTSYGLGSAEDYVGSGTIDIAQVQLCAGDVALPFQPKSFEDELRACQRYYYKIGAESAYDTYGTGWCTTTTQCRTYHPFPVKMRTIPTIETDGTAAHYTVNSSSSATCSAVPALGQTNTLGTTINFTVASGLTANDPCFGRNNNEITAWLAFTAEL